MSCHVSQLLNPIMSSYIHNAFPAGYESDASDEECDMVACSDTKSHQKKIVDATVPEATDDVSKLKRAIYAGDRDTVEQLVDNGMDVETRLGLDWTPLMCAVSVANYDVAKLLLDRGASANFSKDHWTVLMASCTSFASEEKLARCVELLLSRNADPNMANRSQMTCLMLAARDGYSKVINLLVSHGADINFQDNDGYTALSLAVRFGREEAVLKLLQLGADKTLRTKAGKSPADLAVVFKHTQIGRILASSSHISTAQAFSSMEDTVSKFLKTNSDPPPSKESFTKLDELELLLHGLDLGYLIDIMNENNITWSYLLTMEKEDMEKIGIKDQEDQKKVLNALQQMDQAKVDRDPVNQLGEADSGSEKLLNCLISVRQQCCYLTETIHAVIGRFPRHSSELFFSLDPNKDAQAICNQLIIQTNDMQKEVLCLRTLLCQMGETKDDHLPRGSISKWRLRSLNRMALSMFGAAFLLLFYKAAGGKVNLQMYRSVC